MQAVEMVELGSESGWNPGWLTGRRSGHVGRRKEHALVWSVANMDPTLYPSLHTLSPFKRDVSSLHEGVGCIFPS